MICLLFLAPSCHWFLQLQRQNLMNCRFSTLIFHYWVWSLVSLTDESERGMERVIYHWPCPLLKTLPPEEAWLCKNAKLVRYFCTSRLIYCLNFSFFIREYLTSVYLCTVFDHISLSGVSERERARKTERFRRRRDSKRCNYHSFFPFTRF